MTQGSHLSLDSRDGFAILSDGNYEVRSPGEIKDATPDSDIAPTVHSVICTQPPVYSHSNDVR